MELEEIVYRYLDETRLSFKQSTYFHYVKMVEIYLKDKNIYLKDLNEKT